MPPASGSRRAVRLAPGFDHELGRRSGPATFSSTDTQRDAATGKAVVCQYLVTFGGEAEEVGVTVSLLDDTELGNRAERSVITPTKPPPFRAAARVQADFSDFGHASQR
jgi:hypothetical protein